MDCEELIDLICGYMDDDIDELMRDMLEEHICECARCMALLHTLQKTVSYSREMHRRRKVPEKVIEKVYYEIRIRYKK